MLFAEISPFALLFVLSVICYRIRIYRHVLLGDIPGKNMFAEFFSKRTWLYIWKYFLVMLKWLLFMVVFAILGGIVTALVGINIHGAFISPWFAFLQQAVVWLCAAAGLWFVVEQFTLIGPDVAIGGQASLSRLKRLAKRYRLRIALIVIVVGVVGWLVSVGINLSLTRNFSNIVVAPGQVLTRWLDLWKEHSVSWAAVSLLIALFSWAWWLLSVCVYAVIYKRLSPTWPALEAAASRKRVPLAKSPMLAAMDGE